MQSIACATVRETHFSSIANFIEYDMTILSEIYPSLHVTKLVHLLIQSKSYSNKNFGIFSMLIDPGAPGQAYVVGIICHLPDMIRVNGFAKNHW